MAIHLDDEEEYYRMYYPVAGGAVPNDAKDFISRRVQARIDAAADNTMAAGGGAPASTQPALAALPNPWVDGPTWKWPNFV